MMRKPQQKSEIVAKFPESVTIPLNMNIDWLEDGSEIVKGILNFKPKLQVKAYIEIKFPIEDASEVRVGDALAILREYGSAKIVSASTEMSEF